MSMISGQPERPDLLRQFELGSVPKEMAEENKAAEEREDGKKARPRRRWFQFWRRS